MKHSLQLRLSQHLTLTPQLQQSIRLLQLSTLELNQEIERLLMENPLLEREDAETDAAAPPRGPPAPQATSAPETAPRRRRASPSATTSWPAEVAAASRWRAATTTTTATAASPRPTLPTLRDHLHQQLSLTQHRRARPRAGRRC